MREPVMACIGVGANLGDALQTVRQALAQLAQLPGTQVWAQSGLYRSAPVGAQGPDFINAVALIQTQLSAPQLLDAVQQLETAAGRLRPYPNAPRTLDVDVLLYGQARIDSARLTVPHPRMWARAFVLKPLAQVWPDAVPLACLQAVGSQKVVLLDGD